MAFSKKTVLIFLFIAILCVGLTVANERQPLFADNYASSRQLPQRFQEMIRRRKLAQAGSYGTSKPTTYGTYGAYGR